MKDYQKAAGVMGTAASGAQCQAVIGNSCFSIGNSKTGVLQSQESADVIDIDTKHQYHRALEQNSGVFLV